MDIVGWVNWLTMLLESWASATWAAWLAFPLAMLDGFFPPAPADTFMTSMVSLIGPGDPMQLAVLIACGAVGALAGDALMWKIGHYVHPTENSRLGRLALRGLEHADGHWGTILTTARFIPVLRVGVFLGSGVARVPLRTLLVRDGVAAVIWSNLHLVAGLVGGAIAPHPLVGMVLGCLLGLTFGIGMSKAAERLSARKRVSPAAKTATTLVN